MPDSTDRDLAARCADGESPAWAELVARHDRRIQQVLRRALGRRGAAELPDLRQEVYARLLARGGAGLRGLRAERPGALAAFLCQVALRVALDHARGGATRELVRGAEARAGELSSPGPSPEHEAERQQARRRLSAAIERACAGPHAGRDRVVLRAHFDDGFSPAEIARLGCGLSAKGVEALLRRAGERIGEHLVAGDFVEVDLARAPQRREMG